MLGLRSFVANFSQAFMRQLVRRYVGEWILSCDNCLRISKVIRSPNDLSQAIKLAKLKVDDGVIKYIGFGSYGDPFYRIASGKGWGDFVDNYFRCENCNQLISLHAETYHGSGGKLEHVNAVDGELINDTYPT